MQNIITNNYNAVVILGPTCSHVQTHGVASDHEILKKGF